MSALATAPFGFIGVNAEDVYAGDAAYQERMLSEMQANGVTEIRQIWRWKYTEPQPGAFDWNKLDTLVLAAARHNIRILPLLGGEPDWASGRPSGNTERCLFPPRNNADFANFARQVVLRYGRGGTFWNQHPGFGQYAPTAYELWNEPNKKNFWACKVNASAYVALAREAASAIRQVDPKATLMNGGSPKEGKAPGKFLKGMFKAGAGKVFNALALHPYAKTPADSLAEVRSVRKLIDSYGYKRWTIYVTECGWASSGPKSSFTVSESEQAKLVKDELIQLGKARKSLKIASVDYYEWHDLPPPTDFSGGKDYWGLHTGLLQLNDTPKPALSAVLQASRQIH